MFKTIRKKKNILFFKYKISKKNTLRKNFPKNNVFIKNIYEIIQSNNNLNNFKIRKKKLLRN